jgi:hypothetical protein
MRDILQRNQRARESISAASEKGIAMNDEIKAFRDLIAWQRAMELENLPPK